MRPATLILALLLALLGSAQVCAAASPGRAGAAAPAPRAPAQQADEDEDGPQAAQRPPVSSASAKPGERRRRSYAGCNRESHKRNLHGGSRRRFLIRCKLGYERRQPAHQAEPAPPGKRS